MTQERELFVVCSCRERQATHMPPWILTQAKREPQVQQRAPSVSVSSFEPVRCGLNHGGVADTPSSLWRGVCSSNCDRAVAASMPHLRHSKRREDWKSKGSISALPTTRVKDAAASWEAYRRCLSIQRSSPLLSSCMKSAIR